MSRTTQEQWAFEDCEDLLLQCERCGELFYSWEWRRACPDCDWEQIDDLFEVSLPSKLERLELLYEGDLELEEPELIWPFEIAEGENEME